ncbi:MULTISPECIES: chorismate pyruvate-lyase family protein [unclassified Okeania]|uniref:chorismate--pyruvate lyase family protein n=1 Tax=unclassified Okeania TaxID=2634635 RepID=UPI002579E80F|nr:MULTISPECIES: chorismate pyruvate-lyase family protein [unclassified Okeania]
MTIGKDMRNILAFLTKFGSIDRDIWQLQLSKGEKVIERKIFLKGKISSRNYIYAESILALERLEENFRKELLETQTPIGKVWRQQRIETFKEIVETGKKPVGELSKYFSVPPESNLLFRSYCVLTNGKSVMMITEHFPESYFLED